jgi:hypothetical protein
MAMSYTIEAGTNVEIFSIEDRWIVKTISTTASTIILIIIELYPGILITLKHLRLFKCRTNPTLPTTATTIVDILPKQTQEVEEAEVGALTQVAEAEVVAPTGINQATIIIMVEGILPEGVADSLATIIKGVILVRDILPINTITLKAITSSKITTLI